jgi:hypothetical protein
MAEAEIRVTITKSKLRALLAKLSTAQGVMDEARSSMGGLVADACENQNLHKGAFRTIRKWNRMDPVKRDEEIAHVTHMIAEMGWGKAGDLFRREASTEDMPASAPRPKRNNKPRLVAEPEEELEEAAG